MGTSKRHTGASASHGSVCGFAREARLDVIAPAFDVSPVATLLVCADGFIHHLNPAAEVLFGPVEEAGARTFESLLASRDGWRRFEGELADLAAARAVSQDTYVRRDGSAFLGEASGAAIRDGQGVAPGSLIGCVIALRDLTEQGREERSRRDDWERRRLALKTGRAGLWVWDFGSSIRFEDAPRALTFRGDADIAEDAWLGGVHGKDYSRLLDAVESVLKHPDREFEVDFRLLEPNGGARWFRMCGRVTEFDRNSQPRQLAGVLMDIDGEKRAESERRTLEQLLTLVIDGLPQRVFWKDLESRYLGCNATLARLAGLEKSEMVGKLDSDLPWRTHSDLYLSDDCSVLYSGVPRLNMEEPFHIEAGSHRWLRTSKVPLRDEDGEIVGVLGTSEDVTEERDAKQELKAAKETAEIASRTKSEFLARMSHEIRTPMNAILGLTELVLDSELTAEQRENLRTVRTATEDLVAIFDDLLDFSKIESGRLALCLGTFDVHSVLKRAAMMMTIRAEARSVRLRWTIDESVPRQVTGDQTRLMQVVYNLIGNAIKFTPPGGDVAFLLTSPPAPAGRVRLQVEVRDTGIGIPAAKREQIFQAFTQVDNSSTRRAGGTGLGLTIVKALAELMDGNIAFESAEGKGSTFRVAMSFYPAVQPDPQPAAAAENRATAAKNLRVLVVEDSIINQRIMARMLERENCVVVLADNGQRALDWIQNDRGVDLILMDCQMPVLDGWAATKEMRRMGVESPIIAVTANAMEEDEERCRAAGMSGFLTKPLPMDRLREVLETARVHQQQFLPQAV